MIYAENILDANLFTRGHILRNLEVHLQSKCLIDITDDYVSSVNQMLLSVFYTKLSLMMHGTLCNIGSYERILKSYYNFFFKIFKLHNICQKITRINLTKDKKVSN